MTPFKFPPPPPPPPKATGPATDSPQYAPSQRGGHNNSRGRRERGGQARGGRGNNGSGGSRGGHGHNGRGAGNQQHRGGFRGGHQQGRTGGGSQTSPRPTPMSPPPAAMFVPGGPSVNPLFPNQVQHNGSTAQQQVNSTDIVQAMAVLSSPAGMQAMSQFASQMAAGVFPAQPSPTSPQVPPSQSAYRPHIGQKRKRDERPSTQQPPKSKSKPPRAKVAAAPAVPSFGFDLPALHAPKPFGPPKHNVKGAQKRPTVNLGLTSRGNYKEDIGAEDESEDDDEEALFASQSGAGADFEYEGQQMSLRTAAEIKAWIKDRKKQYPTRRRIVEKAQEAAEERDRELDFLQNLQAEKQKTTIQRPRFDETQKNVERKKPPREEQQRDFEGRRKRAPESLVAKPTQPQSSEPGTLINGSPPHKPAVIDLGLGYNSDSDSDDNSIISESSVLSSSDDSDSDSDDSSGAPQEMSSQIAPESKKVPLSAPAPKNAPGVKLKKVNDRVCLWWEKNGRCKHGYKCKFKHPPKEEPTKKGLFEVMVEKEIEEENWKVLRAIKWLGQHGYLG